MDLPARRLARVSLSGRELHIIDWRKDANGATPSLCGPDLMQEPGLEHATLPVCRLCLTAEELLRARVVFSDIKINRLAIGSMTLAQAMLAALEQGAPGTAIIAVVNGAAVLQWYSYGAEAADEPIEKAS